MDKQDIAISLVGGYTLITVLVPIMIFLMLVFMLISMATLSSISEKLSRLISIMEENQDLNEIIALGEAASGANEIHKGGEAKEQDYSASIAILGVAVGALAAVLGGAVGGEVASKTLIFSGVTLAAISVIIPIYRAAASRRGDIEKETSDNPGLPTDDPSL